MNERSFYTVRGYQLLNHENKLTSSMEDYLEMIYRISLEEEFIRINQLAKRLHVRPSSTTKIVQKLESNGLIYYQKYGLIKLTDTGKEIGAFLLQRHMIIENFLNKIGVEETLLQDTEMIEHDMSPHTLENIHILNEFFTNYPEVLKLFKKYKEEYHDYHLILNSKHQF